MHTVSQNYTHTHTHKRKRGEFIPNILQAKCLLLSHTQLYLQPLSENAASITHEQGLACSKSVSMDLTVELSQPPLTMYLYVVGGWFSEADDLAGEAFKRNLR